MSYTKNLLLPPKELQGWVGGQQGASYINVGRKVIECFIKLNLFNRDYKILDAGCGAGRIARHLVEELNEETGGEYQGFDVHEQSIKWATDNITKYYKNFVFRHLDVYNSRYNPEGLINNPKEIAFPYEDSYFNFTFSTSLFTHMTRPYVESYIKELKRVCKRGADIYATFFCYENEINEFEQIVKKRIPELKKLYKYDEVSYVRELVNPSKMVIYKSVYLKNMIDKFGFKIIKSSIGWQAEWIFKNNK